MKLLKQNHCNIYLNCHLVSIYIELKIKPSTITLNNRNYDYNTRGSNMLLLPLHRTIIRTNKVLKKSLNTYNNIIQFYFTRYTYKSQFKKNCEPYKTIIRNKILFWTVYKNIKNWLLKSYTCFIVSYQNNF